MIILLIIISCDKTNGINGNENNNKSHDNAGGGADNDGDAVDDSSNSNVNNVVNEDDIQHSLSQSSLKSWL